MMKTLQLVLLVVVGCVASLASADPQVVDQSTGEFLPYSEVSDFTLEEHRALASSSDSYYTSSATTKFVSNSEYYDGYQQAWRLLGFYIDCSMRGRSDDDHHRKLQGGEGDHHDEHDNQSNGRCVRYLIWAAYIDPNYEGGGIGEYMHYNAYYKKWDTRPCETHGNGRCAPMDCHLTNTTTWKLLGVYKEEKYASQWFEQLFKHAGYCLWSYSVYSWMQTYREDWPEGCAMTSSRTPAGKYIYTDLKPTLGGNMTLGLYTDSDCRIEFKYSSPGSILAGSYLTGKYARLFNDALEPYKYCQPCRASAIRSSYGSNDDGGRRLEARRLDDDPNEGYFQCDDDAGYTNVNQCMKFRTHTTLYPMTMRDVEDASKQGGMLPLVVGGKVYGQSVYYRPVEEKMMAYEQDLEMPLAPIILASGGILLGIGSLVFLTTIFWVMKRRQRQNGLQVGSSEPLMSNEVPLMAPDEKTVSSADEHVIS